MAAKHNYLLSGLDEVGRPLLPGAVPLPAGLQLYRPTGKQAQTPGGADGAPPSREVAGKTREAPSGDNDTALGGSRQKLPKLGVVGIEHTSRTRPGGSRKAHAQTPGRLGARGRRGKQGKWEGPSCGGGASCPAPQTQERLLSTCAQPREPEDQVERQAAGRG
jgi:hypothetical protein